MIFSVKNGCFSYGKNNEILKNINFEAEEGDVISILGPNGVGKTTLLRSMMGLLKWSSGASYYNGKDINNIPIKELFKKISYVPQAKHLSFSYTVKELVLMGRAAHLTLVEKPKEIDFEIADMAIRELGIEHLINKSCNHISGGELQMVLIARAICQGAKILVLDEPESNLDFKNQLIILDIIKNLSKKGITCIFNTHYPAHALNISNKALILGKNKSTKFGNSKEIINSENMTNVFEVIVDIKENIKDTKKYTTVTALKVK